VTAYAAGLPERQDNYIDCWSGLNKHFDPNKRDPA
jgi:homogentisate 1,2-dioxygenase